MTDRVNYNVKKIENGYLVEYYLDGDFIAHAFENWKDTLDFLKENPPRVLEKFQTTEFIEV